MVHAVLYLTGPIRGQWTSKREQNKTKQNSHFRTLEMMHNCRGNMMPDLTLRWLKTARTMMQWSPFWTDPRNRPWRRWGSSEEVSESRHRVKLWNVTSNSWWGIENMIFSDMTWIEFRHSEHKHAPLNWVMLTHGGRQQKKMLIEKQRSMSSSHLFPMFLGTNNQPWLKFFLSSVPSVLI